MITDLLSEQKATLSRQRLRYCLLARILFLSMDILYGKKTTLPKIRFLEILARIPYQAWEIRQYWLLNRRFCDETIRHRAEDIIQWGRTAQDNEYWHLIAAREKMKQNGMKDNWFWYYFVLPVAVCKYTIFSRLLAFLSIKTAWRLNGDFEDHAEHTYMQYVADNPQLEEEQVETELIHDGRGPDNGRYRSWADVFRRFGLDEREHRNESLKRCGMEDKIA